VTLWSWSFGDGATSTVRNPSRTYGTAGTYTVTLVVTDDDGATHQRSAPVTVSAPTSSIALTASGYTNDTKHFLRYNWSGAVGEKVDLYRNDMRTVTTLNDGHQLTGFEFQGTATWRMKVCQAGSTVCSAEQSVTLSN
jgi:serine protease